MGKIGRLRCSGKYPATGPPAASNRAKNARKTTVFTSPQLNSRYMPTIPSLRLRPSDLCLAALAVGFLVADLANGQEYEPRVARVQMQLKFGDDLVDVIEPGELLTIVGEQEKAFVILTHPGRRGLVDKVNALKLSEAVEIY